VPIFIGRGTPLLHGKTNTDGQDRRDDVLLGLRRIDLKALHDLGTSCFEGHRSEAERREALDEALTGILIIQEDSLVEEDSPDQIGAAIREFVGSLCR
jgi:hypothetical protein